MPDRRRHRIIVVISMVYAGFAALHQHFSKKSSDNSWQLCYNAIADDRFTLLLAYWFKEDKEMLDKSKEIFEIGGPVILEECFTVSERPRAMSETGITDHSQNGNRILRMDCRDIRFRKSDWSVKLPVKI